MGWKGTLRSLTAAARVAEREAERQHRAALKAQEIADAEAAVGDWEDYLDDLLSIHKNLTTSMDWRAILDRYEPVKPVFRSSNEFDAQEALDDFRPGLFDFVFGGTEKRKKSLESKLLAAQETDQTEFASEMREYETALAEWKADTDLARRVLDGDPEAYKEVISEAQGNLQYQLMGSEINYSFAENFVHAKPKVHTDEIVPKVRRKQLASGRLSQTKMPKGQFNELYQDYVASVALKVAGDIFQVLPLDEAYVTCQAVMLNTKTGHKELTPILSVQFVRPTFISLNLARLDPSDSLSNFNHVMNFKKTKGFLPIEPLQKNMMAVRKISSGQTQK